MLNKFETKQTQLNSFCLQRKVGFLKITTVIKIRFTLCLVYSRFYRYRLTLISIQLIFHPFLVLRIKKRKVRWNQD